MLLSYKIIKKSVISEHIETISYRMERTMIVCNSNTEAEQVAKHFDSKDIPNELIKEIESNCEYADQLSIHRLVS